MSDKLNVEPKNSAEEFCFLAKKYGFSDILSKKMTETNLIHFIRHKINIQNKDMASIDIRKFVNFCRKEMINDLVKIVKCIQNDNKSGLNDLKRDIDIRIQSILAACYGSLISSKSRNSLEAINKFDHYIRKSNISNAKLLTLAKRTLINV